MGYTYRLRRDVQQVWYDKNPILDNGEPGIEEDTGKFKMGNGHQRWRDLPYFAPAGSFSDPGLLDHINSALPHSVYDNGPSLVLLYENAKV